MGRRAFSAIVALALSTCSAGAETSVKEIAARVELHPIQSLTIPDKQFLTGDPRGQEVTVAGEFRIAQGTGRLPAVILMHGSSGVGANIEPWVHRFNAMGISTFVIDGFTGRGLTTVGTNQALLGRLNFIADIYRGLDILAHHSRVDPDRIARIREAEPGLLVNTATQLPFSYKDACVELDPHVGGDAEATQAAYAAVSDLFRQVLKLN